MVEDLLSYNEEFVKNEGYEPYQASRYPDRCLAIVACMDTRLIELLPAALGIKNGDAKTIKNVGGVIIHLFGSIVRSLLIAIYELGVEEILVIGHTDCGVQHTDAENLLENMHKRGISNNAIKSLQYCGVDLDRWLEGFDDGCVSVARSVGLLKKRPLIPKDVRIHGFMMDSISGKLSSVSEWGQGYQLIFMHKSARYGNDIPANAIGNAKRILPAIALLVQCDDAADMGISGTDRTLNLNRFCRNMCIFSFLLQQTSP